REQPLGVSSQLLATLIFRASLGRTGQRPIPTSTFMIPFYRDAFNANFTPEKYKAFRRELASRCGMEIPFQVSETPCFFSEALVSRLEEEGKELIRQLVDNPDYRARSEKTIPPQFRVPNEAAHPMFIQVDFGLVKNAGGE